MPSPLSPAEALAELEAGNARFVAGAPNHEPYGPRVAELAAEQSPFAAVLGCSDSRVPVETIFDQLPGRLFVVRVAGNFLNEDNLGSIEFAVELLKVPLVMVLGHSNCGAIRAAIAYVRDGTHQPGNIQGVVEAVTPPVRAVQGADGDWFDNAVAENVARSVEAMTATSKIISNPVSAGEVQVIGGIYNVTTGRVDFR
jgi:carbonic anhydrase